MRLRHSFALTVCTPAPIERCDRLGRVGFRGIGDGEHRDNLAVDGQPCAPGFPAHPGRMMGVMMMGGAQVPSLKKLDPEDRVRSIDHCGDTYKVATGDGKVRDFWERNLRFKTDVSDDGPQKGAPALVGAGMMGDRADVIFASPDEISGFISHTC